jgi:transcriptional regulator with PAS, ATPase and Fis domain
MVDIDTITYPIARWDADNGVSISTMAKVERDHIFFVLKYHEGNRTKTAKTLGIGIRTLQRKLKKYQEAGAI